MASLTNNTSDPCAKGHKWTRESLHCVRCGSVDRSRQIPELRTFEGPTARALREDVARGHAVSGRWQPPRATRRCLDCTGTGDKQPMSGEHDCESCRGSGRQPLDE